MFFPNSWSVKRSSAGTGYLAEQLEEQKRQEAETEQLFESELQQAWARREALWRQEKAARDRLMKDVIDTRRLQIQEKCKENAFKNQPLYVYNI